MHHIFGYFLITKMTHMQFFVLLSHMLIGILRICYFPQEINQQVSVYDDHNHPIEFANVLQYNYTGGHPLVTITSAYLIVLVKYKWTHKMYTKFSVL